MWPLTIIPPCCKEAWIVNCTDTFISLIETISRFHRMKRLKENWIDQPLLHFHDDNHQDDLWKERGA